MTTAPRPGVIVDGTWHKRETCNAGPLPLLTALSGQWHAAVAAGHGRQDISAARLALGSPSRQG